MLRRAIFCLAMLLAAGGALRAVGADSETEAFIRDIIKDASTDSQRSTMLMEAASLTEGNEKLKIVLLERSAQYGIKVLSSAEACRKLEAAVTYLAKYDPERKPYWLGRKSVVYGRWSSLTKSSTEKRRLIQKSLDVLVEAASHCGSAGDWKQAAAFYNQAQSVCAANRLPNSRRMIAFFRTSTYLYKAQTKIGEHIAAVKKLPDDLDTRSELIRKLVTVMDDPGQATGYLNDDVDQLYRTFVPMAARDVDELPAESCKDLGDWYHKELSKNAVGVAKSRMLARAMRYYKRVLDSHGKSDVTSAVLKMSVSRIKSALEQLGDIDPLLCAYCSATGRMVCTGCAGTGLKKCRRCLGVGRGKCTTCGGTWRMRCSRCGGKGKIVSGRERRGAVYYKTYSRCRTCDGKGVTYRRRSSKYGSSTRAGSCPTCSKQKDEKLRGTSACSYCRGKGGSGICYTCKGSKTVKCSHCSSH